VYVCVCACNKDTNRIEVKDGGREGLYEKYNVCKDR